MQDPCALAGVVGVGPGVTIDERAGQGAIDEDGELARGGGEGFGLPDADGQPPVESAEGGLAPDEAQGGHPKHGGRAIGGWLGAGAEATTARDLVLRGEREPRREMLLGGPPAEVGPDLGQQLERGIGGDAIDLGEVGAGQMVERRAHVKGRFIPVAAGNPWAGQGGGGRVGRGGQGLQLGLDGGVAGDELRLTQVKELEILPQDEDVLVTVVARQRGGDLVARGLAVGVTVLGEDVRVAFAGYEGAEDP